MASSEVIMKRVTRTTKTIDDSEPDVQIRRTRNYQVYRGMSPTTSNRLEIRIRELEDSLDAEREGRMRAEKEATEYSYQFESMTERLEEAEGLSSSQGEMCRKRDGDIQKLKKDLELIIAQSESNEQIMRKRNQDACADLAEQVEFLTRNKSKVEKEKQTLILEVDMVSTQLDGALKAKAHAESKWESLDEQVRRLKAQLEDLARANQDLNGAKARLTQENFELQHQVQDLDSSNGALAKAKSQLQVLYDDAKSKLEEETRQRNQQFVALTNLQVDFDGLSARYEEETENVVSLRAQLAKALADMQQLKGRFDKEMIARAEELDEIKRRMNIRIQELEDLAEQAKSRANKLDKEKNKLMIEIREITTELDAANNNLGELRRRLKASETLCAELQKRVDGLTAENNGLSGDNSRLQGELTRLRAINGDLSDRNDLLSRENKQLGDALREAEMQVKDVTRVNIELTSIRVQLEAEREGLSAELSDTRDALRDANQRAEAATSALNQLRSDMEARLREKDNEIENIRKSSARALEELQRTIIEIETRYKGEMSRLKKKYNADLRELEVSVEMLSRANSDLNKANKALGARVKELETLLEDERRSCEEARQAVTMLERKRIALQTELEDVRSLLETSERARKNADTELYEVSGRVNELTVTVTSLTNDKRRMEADISAMQADMDEALNGRRAAEERADRLQAEVNRLSEELRLEGDNYKNADSLRKQLEIEIREITVRLEEAELFAAKEGKRMVAKLQARLRDLEAELENAERRARESTANARKMERLMNEQRVQAEEDHRVRLELHDQVNTLVIRIKTLRRQLDEAEEVVTITMNKYRKSQTMIEEADQRADMAEKNIVQMRGRARSMSVTREITRVVRV